LTFDKVVGSQFDVLVKFDKQYPYGDKEDAFKAFTERIGNTKSSRFLVAEVGVQDYGDKLNMDLSERFNVQTSSFPVYKLFKAGSTTPIEYTSDITADSLSAFVKQELKIWIGLPGCLEPFDKLAQQFMEASSEDSRNSLLSNSAALAETVSEKEKESAQFYVLVMKRVAEKGKTWLSEEPGRISKLVASKITDQKKAQLKQRLNILLSFNTPLPTKEL